MRELLTRTGDYGCPAAERPGTGPAQPGTRGSSTSAPRPPGRPWPGPGTRSARWARGSRSGPAARGGDGVPGPAAGIAVTGRSRSGSAGRAVLRIARAAAAAALIVVAAPVSLVAAGSAAAAWLAGWPPARLYRAALLVPADARGLAGGHRRRPPVRLSRAAAAPYLAWLAMWHSGAAGSYPGAAAVIAPVAIPAGLAAGGLVWAYRIRSMETGSGGLSPDAAVAFDQRQWRHQARTRAGADRRPRRGAADHAQTTACWSAP